MAQIHHDMGNFKNKIMAQLEETEKFGLQEFDKLRRMLRADKVQCQEVQLRFKRQCQ
jgi:urease accessory protein UreE